MSRAPIPSHVLKRMEALRAAAQEKQSEPLSIAHDLKAREEAGERLSFAQKAYWRTALRNPLERA